MSKSTKITVPETFSHVLKAYVKDAVRTQPYDLLTWSATYFRSIANDVETPTKFRFEEGSDSDKSSHSLTKGYLKVLVKQVGKGYFVERKILQAIWKGLGLSENELLIHLCVCGMYACEQIHWLKLLSLLAASICENFPSSIDLICEILTEDADGGENSIPFWMFTICYTFLAQLDCSSDRRVTSEQTAKPDFDAITLNAQSFRCRVLTEWKTLIKRPKESEDSDFMKTFNDIKNANDFQKIIQALEKYQSETNTEEHTNDLNIKLHEKLISEIGAPWNWIYQFVSHNSSHVKSYNFCECAVKDASIEQETIALNEPFECFMTLIPGVGSSIPPETVETFLNHIKSQTNDDGLIFPKQFIDSNCPPMI